jgi:hypothetical protein
MHKLAETNPELWEMLLGDARKMLPDFVLDDDWPDARDKLASDLEAEFPEHEDLIEDIADDLMVAAFSNRT